MCVLFVWCVVYVCVLLWLCQAAEKCLAEFMREIQASSSASGGAGVGASSVDFGAMVPILTHQCSKAKDVGAILFTR